MQVRFTCLCKSTCIWQHKCTMYMCMIIFYPTADEDVPIFYDAVEDVEELSSDEEAASKSSTDPRIVVLRTKLSTITRKRAKIRNGKVSNEATVA